MRILNWEEFNDCVATIADICGDKHLSGVYGLPRGGLCLAVALSHALKIPLLLEPQPFCLVVDDVYETGTSLMEISHMKDITTFVWFSKVQPVWWQAVNIVDLEDWLVFPWENLKFAEQDQQNYQLSRSFD